MIGRLQGIGIRAGASRPGHALRVRDWRPIRWLLAAAALILTLFVDRAVYSVALLGKDAVEPLFGYQLVRGFGSVSFWIPIALLAGLAHGGAWRRRLRAGLRVLAAALLAGLLAEILKVVVGRERPLLHDGSSVFRPMADLLSTKGLSFPSSHAAVAFGGAWMLWRLARLHGPRWRVGACLALAAAAACGISRMLTGAHFLGDLVGAAIVGAIAAMTIHHAIPPGAARRLPELLLLRRRRRPDPIARIPRETRPDR